MNDTIITIEGVEASVVHKCRQFYLGKFKSVLEAKEAFRVWITRHYKDFKAWGKAFLILIPRAFKAKVLGDRIVPVENYLNPSPYSNIPSVPYIPVDIDSDIDPKAKKLAA